MKNKKNSLNILKKTDLLFNNISDKAMKFDKRYLILSLVFLNLFLMAFGDDASKYVTQVSSLIKSGLQITGGGIGLFGAMQIGLAYMQGNPSAYGDAMKKIVAGGIIFGVGTLTETFLGGSDAGSGDKKDDAK